MWSKLLAPRKVWVTTPCSSRDGNYLNPQLRAALRKRQEVLIIDYLLIYFFLRWSFLQEAARHQWQQRKQQWSDWETQTEEEEQARRRVDEEDLRSRGHNDNRKKYLDASQQVDIVRRSRDEAFEDLRSSTEARIKARRRKSDRWMPEEYSGEAIRHKFAQEQPDAFYDEKVLKDDQGDLSMPFLRSRLRGKVSKIADLMETFQRARQEETDEYLSRGRQRRRSREQNKYDEARIHREEAEFNPSVVDEEDGSYMDW